MTEKPTQKIGLFALIALVVSSSIGSGVFGLTSDLAAASSPGPVLIGWLIVGFGIMMLALSLNNLLIKEPDMEGVFSYPEKQFGPFAGFISGWGYWLSAWLGNVAFATILMSAIGYFIPIFKTGQNLPSIIVASVFSWGLTYIVNKGIESAAAINAIVTIAKLVPLFIFIVVGIILFKGHIFTQDFWGNLSTNVMSNTNGNIMNQIKGCLMVMMWVFVGVEGASMLSSRAEKKSAAGKATIWGLIGLLVIYILASVLPYGYLTQAQLANIKQPAMLYIFVKMVGNWGGWLIGIGMIISILGAWLSWTMLPSETTLLMANQQLLPKSFGKLNKHKAPTYSLVLTAILVQLFLFTLLFTESAYNFALSLCTAVIIICYIFIALYQISYSYAKINEKGNKKQLLIGIFALAFQLFGLFMAGLNYLLLCLIAYIPGIYFYGKARKEKTGVFLSKIEWIITTLIAIGAIIGIWLVASGNISV